ncbi:MAG TPA: hypothetical protein PLQ11_06010 [Beijerinckiaceae bacterium]|nr:hypothetical protein [Beijerinckiaceae bacterium]
MAAIVASDNTDPMAAAPSTNRQRMAGRAEADAEALTSVAAGKPAPGADPLSPPGIVVASSILIPLYRELRFQARALLAELRGSPYVWLMADACDEPKAGDNP